MLPLLRDLIEPQENNVDTFWIMFLANALAPVQSDNQDMAQILSASTIHPHPSAAYATR